MKLIKKHRYIIFIMIVTLALLQKLFTTPTRYIGHDTVFHLANIISLSKTISLKNIFGSKLVTFASNIFGYGTGFFYPKLPHLLAAYLYLIFNDVYTSINIVYFVTTSLSGIVLYNLSKTIFKNKTIALISSIIYLTVPYHITEIYVRDAYAENFMFLASPLVFLGLYNLKDNNYEKFYLFFILGYVIGMYSHLVSMVFLTILVAIFILYYRKIFLTKEKLKPLIISTIIVICLTIPFLITVIEYKATNEYTVFLSDYFASRETVTNQALEISQLYNQNSRHDKIKPYFNYITIILFIITTIKLFFNKTKYKKELKSILLLIVILINLICSKLLWQKIPDIFIMIQFPWRLLVFLSMFVSIYAPVCLISKTNIPQIAKKVIYCTLILFIFTEGIKNIEFYGNYELSETQAIESRSAMGYQLEYLPLNASKKIVVDENNIGYSIVQKRENKVITNDENVEVKIIDDKFPNLTFEINNITKTTQVELPRVYYLGYILKDEKGNKIKLYNNDIGFLTADIQNSGTYKLYHTTTIFEKISNVLGISALIFCIYHIVKRCRK